MAVLRASAEAKDNRQGKAVRQFPTGVEGIAEDQARPSLLRGRVEHSDRVLPMDPKYSPGKHFDGFDSETEPQTESWIQIPSWLAGIHRTEKSVVTARMNFRTGKRSQEKEVEISGNTSQLGDQIDGSGNIWHLNKLPYRVRVDKVTKLNSPRLIPISF